MKSLMKITTLAYLVLSAVIFVSCKPKDELASLKKDLKNKKIRKKFISAESTYRVQRLFIWHGFPVDIQVVSNNYFRYS